MKITWCTTQAILDKCVVSLDCDLCSFNYSLYNFSCHVHDLYMYMFLEGFFFCSVFLQATDFFTFPIYICIYNISFKGKVQISCPDKKKATDDSSAKYKYRILQHMFSDCCNIRELHCTLYSLIFQTAGRSSRSYSVVYHDINLVNSIVRVCDEYVDISLW